MPVNSSDLRRQDKAVTPGATPVRSTGFRHVLACVDTSPMAEAVAAQASSIAQAMQAQLTVMHAQDTARSYETPIDPVAWELSRQELRDRLEDIVEHLTEGVPDICLRLVDGPVAECICRVAQEAQADLIVMGARSGSGWAAWRLGSNVHKILDGFAGSVMVVQVPPQGDPVAADLALHPQRLMVPLDCSHRAESALVVAQRIAEAHDADLVLTHALPRIEMTSGDPLDAQDAELLDRITRRNERVARAYLDRIRARSTTDGRVPEVRVLRDPEPRPALVRAVAENHIDLLVISDCGQGAHHGTGIGSTADFLISHTSVPVLIVRRGPSSVQRDPETAAPRSRQPRAPLS